MKKTFLTLVSTLLFICTYSQIDTTELNQLDKKGRKIGWWIKYTDSTLTPTTKEKAVLKYYTQYVKGKEFMFPAYYIKDKSKFRKARKGPKKFTKIEIHEGSWDQNLANGKYNFTRYALGDSSKFWSINTVFENGILVYQKYWSHSVKGKIDKIEVDYTIRYKDYPISSYRKFIQPMSFGRMQKVENWVFVKNNRIKVKVKNVREFTH